MKDKSQWFRSRPSSSTDENWYGKDIIDSIQRLHPVQEIGGHSGFHLRYDEDVMNEEAIEYDITQAVRLHKKYGLPLETFIYPFNKVGFQQQLKDAGIKTYRGLTKMKYQELPCRPFVRILNFLQNLIGLCPPTVTVTEDESGLVNIPDSMFILDQTGIRRFVSKRVLAKRGMKGIKKAVDKREILHIWFHPHSFSYRNDKFLYSLEKMLEFAAAERRAGNLEIMTMGQISNTYKRGEL